MLPNNVLKLIREYSKPLTHPNWKRRRWIPINKIFLSILTYSPNIFIKQNKLYELYLQNLFNYKQIDCVLSNITLNGIPNTSNKFDISESILLEITKAIKCL